jgi:hypothetical protein
MAIRWKECEANEAREILAGRFKDLPPGKMDWVFGSRVFGKAEPFSELCLSNRIDFH